jgi:hypothetical protein
MTPPHYGTIADSPVKKTGKETRQEYPVGFTHECCAERSNEPRVVPDTVSDRILSVSVLDTIFCINL